MKVDIIITNPNHHVLITLPVARQLQKQRIEVNYISLCEVRKFRTPEKLFNDIPVPYKKFNIKVPKGKSNGSKETKWYSLLVSFLMRQTFWFTVLRPKLRRWLKGTTHAILLNDTAYPGNFIVSYLKNKKVKTILMQEGIRFPLPVEAVNNYGSSGVDYLVTWGVKSKEYFDTIVHPRTQVVALGSPGFDKSLYLQQSLDSVPDKIEKVAIFGNPIDDQKFVTHDEKNAIYVDLARTICDYAKSKNRKLEVVFKNHPRESPEYLRDILQKNGLGHIKVYESNSDIDIVINTVDAGIVFASTVGINVIVHGKKLAVVKLKNHDYLGDYVQDNVAYSLNIYNPEITEQLDDFLSGEHYHFRNYRYYLDRFAANAGNSEHVVAKFISELE
ncbi:MAG: hypothetical protein HKP14_05345 [Bacteroidia bacterium]|nr:hypothetical protein [Bacteroidia bacterium]